MKHRIVLTLLLFISYLNAQEKNEVYTFTREQARENAFKNNYAAINAAKDIDSTREK